MQSIYLTSARSRSISRCGNTPLSTEISSEGGWYAGQRVDSTLFCSAVVKYCSTEAQHRPDCLTVDISVDKFLEYFRIISKLPYVLKVDLHRHRERRDELSMFGVNGFWFTANVEIGLNEIGLLPGLTLGDVVYSGINWMQRVQEHYQEAFCHIEQNIIGFIMWTLLCMLTPEVVGVHILSHLQWLDVVRLDSSLVSEDRRARLHSMLCALDHLNVPNTRYPFFNITIWQWFWKRNVRLSGIDICDKFEPQWRAIQANAHLIAGGITVTCNSFGASMILSKLFREESSPFHLVSGFQVLCAILDQPLADFCTNQLTNLKEVLFSGGPALKYEQWFRQMVLANPSLERLKLQYPLIIDGHLGALTTLSNLRVLVLINCVTNDEFVALVRAYPLLESIVVSSGQVCPSITEESLMALAQFCPQLRSVSVHGGDPAPIAMLELALHCSNLCQLDFPMHTTITDATLSALSSNCARLSSLRCGWTAAVGGMGIIGAAKVLSQLRVLEVDNHRMFDARLFTAALRRTVKLQTLKLTSNSAVLTTTELDALTSVGSGDLRTFNFDCQINERVGTRAVDAAFARMAQRNPRLTHFQLGSNLYSTSAMVLALAQHCPQLQEVALLSVAPKIADDALIALAQGCPQLRVLEGVFGTTTTDAAILAIAHHCQHLRFAIDLRHSSLVTKTAVEELMQGCWRINDTLHLSKWGIPKSERGRLQAIADAIQRPPGDKSYRVCIV